MDANPVHSFEMQAKKAGLMGMFAGKSMLCLHDRGISWPEGSVKKFVEYPKISILKFSKYYSTVSITHTGFGAPETKKVTLLNIAQFEKTWNEFAKLKCIPIALKAE